MLSELRQSCVKPIIAILERSKEMLRILALNAGADDLLDSECSDMESMARIQAQIRCYQRLHGQPDKDNSIRVKDLEVDDNAKVVRVRGNEV